MEPWEKTSAGLRLRVFVQPRASKNAFVGRHGGELKLMLTAPAVEGAANQGCVEFLAKHFGVAKSRVTILKGEKQRHKVVQIAGDPAALAAKLPL